MHFGDEKERVGSLMEKMQKIGQDIQAGLELLRKKRNELNQTIEQVQFALDVLEPRIKGKRIWSEEQKQEQSEKMKRYWEKRRRREEQRA